MNADAYEGIVGRRLGFLRRGHVAIVAGLLASCGSSGTASTATSTAGTEPPGDGAVSDAPASLALGAALGARCAESEACASRVCLRFRSNAQDAAGICSELCSSATGCGSAAACVAVAALDGGACYPTCSATADCASGLPCVWNSPLDAGLCQPLPTSFCADLAGRGACEKCLGTSCCSQMTACAEDVACSRLESSCPGDPSCASALQSSGSVAAQGLGACAASRCASACQGADAAGP